ncbi:type IV pilin N-terminal domain-containing protein [Haloarcula nitratireducens]|uniref:Type IV pilin n=1 Tax=Haloarcula nitratireducens TaxID=2487749 RepID=A0AAW4PB43_9EURY|nr:type IV pilin [Halomicroarcula nitratireducens]MBX0294808.1 type IV pilin [Halomicroarcula nitratireducens]
MSPTPSGSPTPDQRAVSSIVAVVLLLGLTVAIAGSVSALALGYADEMTAPTPTVAHSSGEYETYSTGGGRYTEQVVRVTHLGGETLRVRDLEIVLDASDACGKTGRLVNLPADGDDLRPTDEFVRGTDIFDNSYDAVEGPIGTGDVDDDGEWTAGETAQFRVSTGECSLDGGDSLVVRVVHAPTNGVVIEERIRVS